MRALDSGARSLSGMDGVRGGGRGREGLDGGGCGSVRFGRTKQESGRTCWSRSFKLSARLSDVAREYLVGDGVERGMSDHDALVVCCRLVRQPIVSVR